MVSQELCLLGAMELDDQTPLRRGIRWRYGLIGLGLLLLAALMVSRSLAARRLSKYFDEMRKAGEPITAVDLNLWQPNVPLAGNRALAVTQAADAIARKPGRTRNDVLERTEEEGPWSAETKRTVRGFLDENRRAIEMAHALGELQYSRYIVDWSSGAATLLPYLSKAKELVQLLRLEARLHLEENHCDRAIQSLLRTFDVAQTLTHEPILISQLVRNACLHLSCLTLQRFLRVCQADEAVLSELTRAVDQAVRDTQGTLQRALIGERSIGNHSFQLSPAQLIQLSPSSSGAAPEWMFNVADTLSRMTGLRDWDQAFYLETMGKWINAASMQFPEALNEAKQISDQLSRALESKKFLYVSRMLLPSLDNAFEKFAETEARLRAARVALAIERYRLVKGGGWPETLEQLAPDFLASVPADPFDGQPIRYRRETGAYLLYSVGRDGTDQAGAIAPPTRRAGSLYDVVFKVANRTGQ